MGVIESAYTYEDQLGSQWDFKILSLTGTEEILKFKVQSVNVPFPSLDVERKKSGELVFKSYSEIDEFSVTLRESPDFSTYSFFQNWFDKFYDRENRVFKVFLDETTYAKYLYNAQVVFTKGHLIAIPDSTAVIPSGLYSIINNKYNISSTNTYSVPTFNLLATNCRPTGIDSITLDYGGQPLMFTVHFTAEKIALYKV